MSISIHIQGDDLTNQDAQILRAVADVIDGKVTAVAAQVVEKAKDEADKQDAAKVQKTAPAKKAVAKKADPEPEAEESSDDYTMEDAVGIATQLVNAGKAKLVKPILTELGAGRVAELKEKDLPAFMAAASKLLED